MRLCKELAVTADWLLGLAEYNAREESSPSPLTLVSATYEEVEGARELDPTKLVHALLGVLAENENLRARLKGARKRTRIEVDNAIRDLQRKVLRGLLGALDRAGIEPDVRREILDAMDREVEDGFRSRKRVG